MFVTVEGIEGCGKSSLISGLAERLRAEGQKLLVTREPGGTPSGDAIRDIFLQPGASLTPLTEALLINASRAQHVVERILPALRAGDTVLCDRFVDSTIAYQGYGRGVDRIFLSALCDMASGSLKPDLTLILDIPVAVSRERVAGRASALDRMDAEDDAFHERVRNGFLALGGRPGSHILDATKPPLELIAQAHALVRERMGS
ncbi:MAG: dTMP kinase [Candidatus Eremiobacteraeota bacterium]|nr:dTMP kinase [Candidatus Eremiobacteraeota bacterium]